jgi:hypothetical protein
MLGNLELPGVGKVGWSVFASKAGSRSRESCLVERYRLAGGLLGPLGCLLEAGGDAAGLFDGEDYWRYEIERESAINARRVRQFV